jgi:hypothetical protein
MKAYYIRREGGVLGSLDGPAIRTQSGLRQWLVEGRLHRNDGPAVESAGGTRVWYWRGVRVPQHVVEHPRSASPLEILAEPNAEVRRAWLESYGLHEALDSLVGARKATVIHSDPSPRRLIVISAIKDVDEAHPVYVEVTCPSTKRIYHLRVAPECKTCQEAVAWTFGVAPGSYAPSKET